MPSTRDWPTFTLAIWGSVLSTLTGGWLLVKDFRESRPHFYVLADVDLWNPAVGDEKTVNRLTVRVANTGSATATLEPLFHVVMTGATLQLAFRDPSPALRSDQSIASRAPILKTGEESYAQTANSVPSDAVKSQKYLTVKFRLIDGREYVADVESTYQEKESTQGNLVGWGGGAIAKTSVW